MQPVMVNVRSPIPVQAERMRALEDRMAVLERQIATGKTRANASDDPAGAARGARLARLDARLEADRRTLEAAASRLAQGQIATAAAREVLLRARDLALTAASDAMGPDDRALIAREVAELRQMLRDLSNRTDETGLPLFAGALGDRPAYALDADGTWRWQGFARGAGAAAAGVSAAALPTGPDLFGAEGTDAFSTLETLAAALADDDPETRRPALDLALDGLERDQQRILAVQAAVGGREARIGSSLEELAERRLGLASALAAVDGVDLTAAIAELQALQLTLAASQAVFARLHQSTLFDRLA